MYIEDPKRCLCGHDRVSHVEDRCLSCSCREFVSRRVPSDDDVVAEYLMDHRKRLTSKAKYLGYPSNIFNGGYRMVISLLLNQFNPNRDYPKEPTRSL